MRERITVPVEKYIYKCDICGKECDGNSCVICGREICRACTIYHEVYECDLRNENEYNSDYPKRICRSCWDMGKTFRERMMEVREAAQKEEEEIMQAWIFITRPDMKEATNDIRTTTTATTVV